MNCLACECPKATPIDPIDSMFAFRDHRPIQRYRCVECGTIYGPMDYVDMTPFELGEEYLKVWQEFTEGPTQAFELKAFGALGAIPGHKYLNFGCGHQNSTCKVLNNAGYNVDGYDAFCESDPLDPPYDGIFSNDLIEHLQNPRLTFAQFRQLLVEEGRMAHYSPCLHSYAYPRSDFHLFYPSPKGLDLVLRDSGFARIKHPDSNTLLCVTA